MHHVLYMIRHIYLNMHEVHACISAKEYLQMIHLRVSDNNNRLLQNTLATDHKQTVGDTCRH